MSTRCRSGTDTVADHLSINGVSFRYRHGLRSRLVFDHLSLRLDQPVTLLLGPNGAGKSTLMRLIAGELRPTGGSVSFAGIGSTGRGGSRKRYRELIGHVPQRSWIISGLTVREHVAYAGWLKGQSKGDAWDRARRALGVVGLLDQAGNKASRLSGGQQRRLSIAQALVHDARLLVMDEPAAGLDPDQRASLRQIVAGLAESVQLVISTHQTDDLPELANDVVLLDRGSVRWVGDTADFLAQVPRSGVNVRDAEAAYRAILGHRG